MTQTEAGLSLQCREGKWQRIPSTQRPGGSKSQEGAQSVQLQTRRSKHPLNDLPELGRSTRPGRKMGSVLGNTLLGDSRGLQPTGAAPPAMGKLLKHQLRVNLGFFLGLSPVLKSFYNGHRASGSAAAASPGRISSSFSSG